LQPVHCWGSLQTPVVEVGQAAHTAGHDSEEPGVLLSLQAVHVLPSLQVAHDAQSEMQSPEEPKGLHAKHVPSLHTGALEQPAHLGGQPHDGLSLQ